MISINSFHGEFAFLSNFFPAQVSLDDGLTYPTVENAYQAAKTGDPKAREFFTTCTPGRAKRNAPHRPDDWFDRSLPLMATLLSQKFNGDLTLRKKLLDTHPAELIEGNTWGDRFWGKVDGEGENHLGILLMKLRGELLMQLSVCSGCGAPIEPSDSHWRWNGEYWEHKCPGSHPQAGHFTAVIS